MSSNLGIHSPAIVYGMSLNRCHHCTFHIFKEQHYSILFLQLHLFFATFVFPTLGNLFLGTWKRVYGLCIFFGLYLLLQLCLWVVVSYSNHIFACKTRFKWLGMEIIVSGLMSQNIKLYSFRLESGILQDFKMGWIEQSQQYEVRDEMGHGCDCWMFFFYIIFYSLVNYIYKNRFKK